LARHRDNRGDSSAGRSAAVRRFVRDAHVTRMAEFDGLALGNKDNRVTIDADIPAHANGVLYSLGATSGGLRCYVEDGILRFEYNLFIL